MSRHSLASASFPAMGVTITIGGIDASPGDVAMCLAHARALAEEWERHFSRFRPDSELQAVNLAAGMPVRVSEPFLGLLEAAINGVRRSESRFDPAILPALESAGYDRSFDRIDPARSPSLPVPIPATWADEVEIDRATRTIRLPHGIRLDFGGIAKGAFVERLAGVLSAHWLGGFVDAGGDLRVWGTPPNGLYWTAGIAKPGTATDDLVVARLYGADAFAVATSGTTRRRWVRKGSEAHHLIDPSTGMPLPEQVSGVTVFAPNAIDAEIETKSLIVAAARGEATRLRAGTLAVLYSRNDIHAILKTPGQRSAEILGAPARATA
jgi:FAD:protein FMN transferase